MKVTGLYTWSAQVEVELPEGTSNDEQRAALDVAAMDVELDFKHPVLHECSNPALID